MEKRHCIGDGNCVACTNDADCSAPEQCTISKCVSNACVSTPAADFAKCTLSGSGNGMCSEGMCQRLVAIRSGIEENADAPYIGALPANPQLAANGRTIGPYETFLQVGAAGNTYAFRSYETKRFITIHADGFVYADGGTTAATATRFEVTGSYIRLTDGSGAYLQCPPRNNGSIHSGKLERQSPAKPPSFWEQLPIEPGTWTER